MNSWMIGIGTVALLLLLIVAFASGPFSVFMMLERSGQEANGRSRTMTVDSADALNQEEINRISSDLRGQYLDQRAESVTWWLMAAGVSFAFLTVFVTVVGIVIVVAGLFGTRWFRDILNEARKFADESERSAALGETSSREAARSLEEIRELARQARQETETIQQQQRIVSDYMTTFAEPVVSSSDGIESRLSGTEGTDPLVERAITEATRLQEAGENATALEKWQDIAHITEGVDHARAIQAWFWIGYLQNQSSEYQSAILAFDRVIQYAPNDFAALNNRGNANHYLGRYAEAVVDYNKVISLFPNSVEGHHNRGNSQRALGKYDDAVDDFDEALRIDPNLARTQYLRGLALSQLRRTTEALTALETALGLANQEANSTLVGEIEQAIAQLRNSD